MNELHRQAQRSDEPELFDQDTAYSEQDDSFLEINLHRIFAAIRRNLIWIILAVVICAALGILATMLMVPKYQATSTILVEQEADQIIENSELTPVGSYQDAERFLQTQVDVIESRALALRVIQDEDLANDPRFFEGFSADMPSAENAPDNVTGEEALANYRQDQALKLLSENLKVSLPATSRLVAIQFESADPVLSARIANAVAENYIESNLNRKFDSSSYARSFLSQQLDEARQQLEESERELNQYSREAGLIRVTSQGNDKNDTTLSVTNDSLVQANSAASSATAARIEAEDRWRNIANVPVLSVTQVLTNPAVQNLLQERSRVETELAKERARHLEEHPSVQALVAQVEQLNQRIESIGNSIKRAVYLDYQSALDQEKSLENRVSDLRNSALDEQDRGVQFNVLKRVTETNRALYDSLLERYNQLNATAGAASNNVSIVDRAAIPRVPSSPNLVMNLALSILLGLALATAIVFLREYFDDVIRAPDDVERKLGLPLLGLVPKTDENALRQINIDRKSDVSEAYHSLVTNLNYATRNGLPRSLVITSAQEGEGKTSSASAIAYDLARLGRKVLLIDGDLRRPTVHRYYGVPKQKGLTDLLAGLMSFEDAIFQTEDQPNLFYMTALPIPPDPSVLLGGPRMGEVLQQAEQLFDTVIIDSPPLLGLSDAPTLAAHAEAVMVIIDASQGHRGAIKAALRRLHLVHANVLGAVLTKFDPQAAGGDYGYYGYKYYRYGRDETAEA
ncbi:GumC family protein [Altericroceibacterium endophyticum]|uniref:non-specific protein-tyrosine kinase n=1 Tax=Altericroceibacterium endophyticum TaxID=1808508 RepID=A0A6I4T8L6_9SPHN|nr:polysaccharide biosynthesis tyrosine autokinase [Altericroceibacterium endophyticum]MXO67028.1 polysaccharide biosynthesis tyrosine autokinase [Altericroceibacterium endophyticum]